MKLIIKSIILLVSILLVRFLEYYYNLNVEYTILGYLLWFEMDRVDNNGSN